MLVENVTLASPVVREDRRAFFLTAESFSSDISVSTTNSTKDTKKIVLFGFNHELQELFV